MVFIIEGFHCTCTCCMHFDLIQSQLTQLLMHTHSTQTNGSSIVDSTAAAVPPGVYAKPKPPILPSKPNQSSSVLPPPVRPKPPSLRRPAANLKPSTAPKPVIVATDDSSRRQGTVYGKVELTSGSGTEVRDSIIDDVAYVTVRRHQN